MREPRFTVTMTAGATVGRYEETTRTWTHIKVLYILSILLSAVVLALFIVCFMMVLEVQRGLHNEMKIRTERENMMMGDIYYDDSPKAHASNQRAEIITTVNGNSDKPILIDKDIKINPSTLTRFCASIHSHCPVRGPSGQQGLPGVSVKGDRGVSGVRGYPGPQGVKGAIGAPGFGLVGPPGLRGEKGSPGIKGQIGRIGTTGLKGEPGEIGPPGFSIKGEPGINGQRGATGLPGHDGVNGLTGLKGARGEQGPSGAPGLKGDVGKMGISGQPGLQGEKGDIGSAGEMGLPGISGLPGRIGARGWSGLTGKPGCKGQKGERGTVAFDDSHIISQVQRHYRLGFKGAKGEPGVSGSSAPLRHFNVKGAKGEPGTSGNNGILGVIGPPGAPGKPGQPGSAGADGHPGLPGRQGIIGIRGPKGAIGLPGAIGSPGVTGPPGPSGMDGFKGDKGERGETAPAMSSNLTVDALLNLNITHLLKGEPGIKGEPGVMGHNGTSGRRGKRGNKGDQGDVLQCECLAGPRGEKGDTGVCPASSVCAVPKIQSDQPGDTPTFVLYQNSTIPERKKDLTIKRIGKPLLHKQMPSTIEWGSWMVDSDPTPTTKDKYYITQHFTGRYIYEYESLDRLVSRSGNYSRLYNLQDQFYGTGGAVYRGAFYYHRAGLNMIARYDLDSKTITAQLPLDDSLYRGSSSLFSTIYNYYDLAVDENGLWVMYAFKPSMVEPAWPDSLIVAKLEPNYLEVEKTWNISVSRKNYTNSFIAQGILYLLDSGTNRKTQFSFAYDLYANIIIEIALPFTNVFLNNRMLSYEYKRQKILVWDSNNLISHPIVSE